MVRDFSVAARRDQRKTPAETDSNTSGTTANPKGVALTHGNVIANLEMVGEVLAFDGLAVAFVRACGARVVLRGLPTLSDMEYEFTMSLMNLKDLENDLPDYFVRVHRSFIVNTRMIEYITAEEISIQGKLIPVGATYRNVVKDLLQ